MDPKAVQALMSGGGGGPGPGSEEEQQEGDPEEAFPVLDLLKGNLGALQSAHDAIANGDLEGAAVTLRDLHELVARVLMAITPEVEEEEAGEDEEEGDLEEVEEEDLE